MKRLVIVGAGGTDCGPLAISVRSYVALASGFNRQTRAAAISFSKS